MRIRTGRRTSNMQKMDPEEGQKKGIIRGQGDG